jgi:uncharacterized protein (TIGR00730 family)
MTPRSSLHSYPTSKEDAASAQQDVQTPQTMSASYRLPYTDTDFLTREELRPVRLQLELLKPELMQQEHGIEATVVVFGGSRIPEQEAAAAKVSQAEGALAADPGNTKLAQQLAIARRILEKSRYYDEARKLGGLLSKIHHPGSGRNLVVITGGGPGIMEAANRGACDVGAKTMGLNIVLPHEQAPNAYITPELCFQFHYFSIRKMHFLMRAQALIAFPGGFGTLDELFETLTLIQTKKIKPLPVLLFGREFWQKLINFEFMVAEGVISPEDLHIFRFVETAEEAAAIVEQHYEQVKWQWIDRRRPLATPNR